MKKQLLRIGLLMLSSVTTLIGCTHPQQTKGKNNANTTLSQEQGEHGKSLQIVTTFPPLYAHTANIIDGNDTLTNLVPPGTSVHTWQPKPSDVLVMEKADIIITNGLGLEKFLENYLDRLEKKGVMVIDTSKGGQYIKHNNEYDNEHDEHHHKGTDRHIRLNINNSKLQVSNITKKLISLDSTQKKVYTQNAKVYTEKLTHLDKEITSIIDTSNIEPFIVFHDAYQYFLQAYNLQDKQVGLVQKFHGDNPSQKAIAKLIEVIRTNSVTTVYTEPQFNPSVVYRLQQETGVQTKEIDPIGRELSKDGYLQMIKKLGKAFANN